MGELTRELANRLIASCNKFAYHEQVAYGEGITIGELRDWLERGAVVNEKDRDPQRQELRRFTREYCRTDSVYSMKMFEEMIANTRNPRAASQPQLWAWFERRWPVGSPLAIGSLLTSDRVEQLSLDEAFSAPNAITQAALDRNGYFRSVDLDNPSEGLSRALKAAGYSRAGPEPSPTG
ncbi:MAG: hypothetical protein A2V88_15465 [Elusimicrobia bacterium RBG_16_66_12]|nr:MAG: hypothetical protein A2V88_15465 [Elusimicrobia bacterium RBG_16_66_12]